MKVNIMSNNIFFQMRKALMGVVAGVAMTFTACNPEPDESDLFTFTGETIESLIAQDSTLTSFNYILSRVGYDKMMAAYGVYTCFAPINSGVEYYCDSLYNDDEAIIPYNGMRNPDGSSEYLDSASFCALSQQDKLEWLSDSLCLNITRYHIVNYYKPLVELTGTGEVQTMLGYSFSYSPTTDGLPILQNKAVVFESDYETVNGLLHKLDNVIPRFTRFIGNVIERSDNFKIFSQALQMTGLADSLLVFTKGTYTFKQLGRDNFSGAIYPARGEGTEGTSDWKVGFTVFAESDEVLAANNIESIDQLIAYANNQYGNCKDWYDYIEENNIEVSTGDDYTNRYNALNMFVAYHIIKGSMSANQLVYLSGDGYWNYKPDADPYDYYETLLPHTMMKIWAPHDVGTGRTLFINRYQTNNTLTNELGTMGTNHQLVREGVRVERTGNLQAYNGWIHPINSLLVYDELVPKGVLRERMRVNCTSLFPELIDNYRMYTISTSPGNQARLGVPNFVFDNIVHYDPNPNVCMCYIPRGWFRCYQKDQMQFWGNYDFAFRLPSVPSGNYEIRVVYAPMDYGSFMQYYIGTSSAIQDMRPLGLPFDATIKGEDPRIGLTYYMDEDDQGIATDVAMHNRGYMRGPYSYYGGTNVTSWTESNNGRADGGTTIRYVLGTVELKQGNDNWLRIKTLNSQNLRNPVGLDFVELVPTSVLDNQEFMEDWY